MEFNQFAQINSIGNIYENLKHRVRSDLILTEDDIVSGANHPVFEEFDILGLWIRKNRVNPSLSFIKSGNKEIRLGISFPDIIDFCGFESLQDVLESKNAIVAGNYIIFSPSLKFEIISFKMLLKICSLVARRSSNSANLVINMNDRISRLMSSIITTRRHSDFDSILSSCTDSFSNLIRFITFSCKIYSDNKIEIFHFSCPKMKDTDVDNATYRDIIFFLNNGIFKNKNTEKVVAACGFEGHFSEASTVANTISKYSDLMDVSYRNNITVTPYCDQIENNILMQPIKLGGERDGVRYFCIFIPKDSITTRNIYNVSTFSTSFESSYRQYRKIQILERMRKPNANLESEFNYQKIENHFSNYIDDLSTDLFSILKCHSFTIRLFKPSDNELISIFSVNSLTGVRNIGSSERHGIPVANFRNSINAFTYLVASHHMDYVYIKNLNKPVPEIYKSLGLERPLILRQESKSEICVPFRFGDVAIGTINIESSMHDAFDDDIDFVLSLRSSLEEVFSRYFHNTDLDWHKLLTRFADPLHELENYLDTNFFNDEQKTVLYDLFLRKRQLSEEYEMRTLKTLRESIYGWINSYYDSETEEIKSDVREILEYNVRDDEVINQALFEAMSSILRNLLKNIEDHSNIRKDKIIISSTARFRRQGEGGDNIRIRYKTHGYISDEILNQMCLRPIYRSNEGQITRHYGMYILGLLARSVGGFVSINRDVKGYPVVIEFTLPR